MKDLLHEQTYPAALDIVHPDMKAHIGEPAVIGYGHKLPDVSVHSFQDGTLSGSVWSPEGTEVYVFRDIQLEQNGKTIVQVPVLAERYGTWEIRLELACSGWPVMYDRFFATVPAPLQEEQSLAAYLGSDGRLQYTPDYKGNRIADYSSCGYGGGGVRIPDVRAAVVVEPDGEEDDTSRIQAAIDQVSSMPVQTDGFRGAVVLTKGTYRIGGTLRIESSGVVLRGQGQGLDGTILIGTGIEKRPLLHVKGAGGAEEIEGTAVSITDLYVPLGARSFHVENGSAFQVGQTVFVVRRGNNDWIHAIQMDSIVERNGTKQWTPFDTRMERIITAVEGNLVTVDAPIVSPIDQRWGGGYLAHASDEGRIEQVGIENMRLVIDFDPTVMLSQRGGDYYADEQHADIGVLLGNVKHAWVRELTGYHLSYALVSCSQGSKWVTIQDCTMRNMVSIITGGRRYTINYDGGLMLLTQRIDAETGRHTFVVGARCPGPFVFLNSESRSEYASSEPHHRYSTGGLYDGIKGRIEMIDRGQMGSGHGWAGANYTAWNTEGRLTAQRPPFAANYVIGHVGEKGKPHWPNANDPRPRQDAYWDKHGHHVEPRSLYLQQLLERLGAGVLENIERHPVGGTLLDTPPSVG